MTDDTPPTQSLSNGEFEESKRPRGLDDSKQPVDFEDSKQPSEWEDSKRPSASDLVCSCRICLLGEEQEMLASICKCRGTLAFVHVSCMERWLSQHARNYCELCLYEFNVIQMPRYSMSRSLRLWVCHPRVRQNVFEDSLLLALLTFVTAGIVGVCMLGLQYFASEGEKLGISPSCTIAIIGTFIGVVLVGYCIIVALIVRDQVLPWYRWWRKCVNVHIVLDST